MQRELAILFPNRTAKKKQGLDMTRTQIGDIRQNGLNSMLCEIYLQKTAFLENPVPGYRFSSIPWNLIPRCPCL